MVFPMHIIVVRLPGWDKSGCGERTREVEQVNSAPISRALGCLFFSSPETAPHKVLQAARRAALPCSV